MPQAELNIYWMGFPILTDTFYSRLKLYGKHEWNVIKMPIYWGYLDFSSVYYINPIIKNCFATCGINLIFSFPCPEKWVKMYKNDQDSLNMCYYDINNNIIIYVLILI